MTGATASRNSAIICEECETPTLYAMGSNAVAGDAKLTSPASCQSRRKSDAYAMQMFDAASARPVPRVIALSILPGQSSFAQRRLSPPAVSEQTVRTPLRCDLAAPESGPAGSAHLRTYVGSVK